MFPNPVVSIVLIRKRNLGMQRGITGAGSQKENYVKTQQSRNYLKGKKKASGETKPANPLILDFWPPEL